MQEHGLCCPNFALSRSVSTIGCECEFILFVSKATSCRCIGRISNDFVTYKIQLEKRCLNQTITSLEGIVSPPAWMRYE